MTCPVTYGQIGNQVVRWSGCTVEDGRSQPAQDRTIHRSVVGVGERHVRRADEEVGER